MELELKTEEVIRFYKRITICGILKELTTISEEERKQVRAIVSRLILKYNWRTCCERGRLFITTEPAHNKDHETITMKHRTGDEEIFTPKYLPTDYDWVVTYTRNGKDIKLYYDKSHERDELRHIVSRLKNIPFEHINACRYHSPKSFRTMHNFN